MRLPAESPNLNAFAGPKIREKTVAFKVGGGDLRSPEGNAIEAGARHTLRLEPGEWVARPDGSWMTKRKI